MSRSRSPDSQKARYWVSCAKFTVGVDVEAGTIVAAAPIVRRFIGQPLDNLLEWAGRLGGLRWEAL